ncbi:hypothetical protein C1H46_013408 [Malus baccata]|uniref:Uncharacterized protein n=1 Tax=Malus baccata TaxID=106549 RepID=A0A540MPZ7_MALBA|nr:hypothetical protein C1H46_013408 [Malus baccata]
MGHSGKGGQGGGPWMCSPSSILRLHVLIHKISTIFIVDFLLFGLVLILSAILTPHSLSLTQFKAFQLFRTNCSNIPALKHLRSLAQFKSTKGPVDTKRIIGIYKYKQRGKEAIMANNFFFYITYEGTVDIDKIFRPSKYSFCWHLYDFFHYCLIIFFSTFFFPLCQNQVQQRATQDQIAYFGQTTSQLLTFPHLKRLPLADVLHLQTIFQNPKEVKPYAVSAPEHCNLPAAAIHASSDAVTRNPAFGYPLASFRRFVYYLMWNWDGMTLNTYRI